jgi:hemoglobin
MSAYSRLGGEAVLRPLIEEFVEIMVNDPMIGFFFTGVDHLLLAERELELTARFLGDDRPYTGRPVKEAHAKHPIMGGQFDRRKQILKEVIERYEVPADIRETWLAHVESMRALVTRDAPGECVEPGAPTAARSPKPS